MAMMRARRVTEQRATDNRASNEVRRAAEGTSPAEHTDGFGDDETLLVQAQGNRVAFAPLYARYWPEVLRFLERRIADRSTAEDLAGQVFVRVVEHLGECGTGPGAFRGWLFAIARNAAIDHYRRRRPHIALAEPPEMADDGLSPEAIALANEERRELAGHLERLTPGQRRVIALRLAGLRGPEIASALGMSVSAVKVQQFRAIQRLRESMGVEGAGSSRGVAGDQGQQRNRP